MTKKRAPRRRRPKDPPLQALHDLANAIGAYLKTIGWTAVVVGSPAILGEDAGGLGRFQFVVTFTGGRTRKKKPFVGRDQ